MTLLDRRIRFSGSGCQNSGKARRAIADKLPYYTGGGTAELTHLTAKGREIIAASDMPNLLARLGPVLGGTAPVPSAAGVGLQDGDFDAINVPGVYTIAGSWTNGPIASSSTTALLAVTRRVYDNLYYQALYWGTSAYRRMTTVVGGLSWPNPWYAVESPTTGTVSQKGGIPTGAVIERGSNANGEYVRFADGTQICTIFYDDTAGEWNSSYFNMWRRAAFLNFP